MLAAPGGSTTAIPAGNVSPWKASAVICLPSSHRRPAAWSAVVQGVPNIDINLAELYKTPWHAKESGSVILLHISYKCTIVSIWRYPDVDALHSRPDAKTNLCFIRTPPARVDLEFCDWIYLIARTARG